jgi:tetratricopeptide (TPR) repeat protein
VSRPVFISHAAEDRELADTICAHLEEEGIACWVAPRNVPLGSVYAEAIVDPIDRCSILLLVLSPLANESRHVHREVELAVSRDRLIVPLRLRHTEPVKALQYLVSATQWLDLDDEDLRNRLGPVVLAVSERLAERARIDGVAVLPRRNRDFVGRQDLVSALEGRLASGDRQVVLFGIPGVGKTELAVEVAHRVAAHRPLVLWVNAETWEEIVASASAAVAALGLDARGRTGDEDVVATLRDWLGHSDDWLLVVDNVDDPELLASLCPDGARGSFLVTSRSARLGLSGEAVEIPPLDPDDSIALLLRASPRSSDDDEREAAASISALVGDLPLALDQAAAFMEHTQTTPREYLAMYTTEGEVMRADAREGGRSSIAQTFGPLLSRADGLGAAGDLLRFCAFLAPEAIPEELLLSSAHLGERLAPAADSVVFRARVIGDAASLSLLHRDPNMRTLSCHRVVQDLVRDSLGTMRGLWLERTVRTIAASLPVPGFSTWGQWQRLAPHVLRVIQHADAAEHLSAELGFVLGLTGAYFGQRGHHDEARQLHRRSLAVREQVLDPRDVGLAWSMHNVAAAEMRTEPLQSLELAKRALALAEDALPADDLDLGLFLTTVGTAHRISGDLDQACAAYVQAIELYERVDGPTSFRLPFALNRLASAYREAGRLEEAERQSLRAAAIAKEADEPDLVSYAYSIRGLAVVHARQGRLDEARREADMALELAESALGAEHPALARFRSTHERAHRPAADGGRDS